MLSDICQTYAQMKKVNATFADMLAATL